MARTLKSTPREDGFRMPGEWAKHKQCWIGWPERTDVWRAGAKPAQNVIIETAKAISEFEPVTCLVSKSQYDNARCQLPENIRLVEMSMNDGWLRDNGPTFVVNDEGEVRGVDWEFEAWGGYYFPWDDDNRVARKMIELENVDRYKSDIVLEGGAIHSDGEGTVIVTEESCLVHNQNPGFDKEKYEEYFREYLGAEKVIWLKHGVLDDCVHGHVDIMCSFVKPGVVMLHWTDDETDPQYKMSKLNLDILENITDARGRKFEIHKIHQPGPFYFTKEEADSYDRIPEGGEWQEGDRLACSYINFYLANEGVVVPLFDDPTHDENALMKFRELFPEKKVVGVQSRELELAGGIIHCMTQQQPE